MKKLIIGLSAVLLVMSGCSRNELLDGGDNNPNEGKIKFSAVNSIGTKAATGHPMNSTADLRKLGKFSVIGYGSYNSTNVDMQGINYLKRQTVTYNGSWEYANEPFWTTGTLDFMAYTPIDGTGAPATPTMGIFKTEQNSTMTFTDFTVQPATGPTNEQIDFVVASSSSQSKSVRTPIVFKHALTQVVFSANIKQNATNPIKVQINNVSIHNIANKGTLVVPRNGDLSSAWSASRDESALTSFVASPSAAVQVSAIVGGNPAYTRIKVDNTTRNELIMIPQRFTEWDALKSIIENDKSGGDKGAYVKINAIITTTIPGIDGILGNADDKDVYLLGALGTPGTLYIPVSSKSTVSGQWTPGKRINYILTFGDQDSGSGGAGYDINGDPILVPIRFTTILENWVDIDVPLLTAEVSASTSALTQAYIEQNNNQIFTDIYNAPHPRSYKAKTIFKSTVEAAANITIDCSKISNDSDEGWFMSSQFLPGSTFTMDFTGAAFATVTPKTISLTPPAGWVAAVGATEATAIVFGTTTVTIDGTVNKKVIVLKKVATAEASYLLFLKFYSQASFAIMNNINGLTVASDCRYEVKMAEQEILTDNIIMESGFLTTLSSFINAGSTIYYEFSIENWNAKTVSMIVPLGWKATVNKVDFSAGSVVTLRGTGAEKSILLTKLPLLIP